MENLKKEMKALHLYIGTTSIFILLNEESYLVNIGLL
jgi:hypothetical protein